MSGGMYARKFRDLLQLPYGFKVQIASREHTLTYGAHTSRENFSISSFDRQHSLRSEVASRLTRSFKEAPTSLRT